LPIGAWYTAGVDRGLDSDQGTVEAADLTLKQAALLVGCSVKTLRRAIHGTTAPSLPTHYIERPTGAQIMIRPADLMQWQQERAGQVTTLDTTVSTGQSALDTLDTVQPSVSSGSAAIVGGIVAPLVAELAEARRTIQQQAEELGALRERLRASEAAQAQHQQQDDQAEQAEQDQVEEWGRQLDAAPAAPAAQPPTQLHLVADTIPPPPPAALAVPVVPAPSEPLSMPPRRPVPSIRARLLRWLRS